MDVAIKTSQTFESLAHQRVLGDILSGELPPKARLKIRDLTERYGIGATPLREALSRLVPEGLVTLEQNKGFRVAALSLRELVEVTEMRQLLEADAFRRSIERGDDRWESEIVASFHGVAKSTYMAGGDTRERRGWEERHRRFHAALVSACGNTKLLQSVDALHRHLVRYRAVFLRTEISSDELRFMHQELMRVALDRDLDAAMPLMRRHVRVNVDQVMNGIRNDPALRAVIDDR